LILRIRTLDIEIEISTYIYQYFWQLNIQEL